MLASMTTPTAKAATATPNTASRSDPAWGRGSAFSGVTGSTGSSTVTTSPLDTELMGGQHIALPGYQRGPPIHPIPAPPIGLRDW